MACASSVDQQLYGVKMPLLPPSPFLDLPLTGCVGIAWTWHSDQLCFRFLFSKMRILLLPRSKEGNVAKVVCKFKAGLRDLAHSSWETVSEFYFCDYPAANGSMSVGAPRLPESRRHSHLPSQSWRNIWLREPRACCFSVFNWIWVVTPLPCVSTALP